MLFSMPSASTSSFLSFSELTFYQHLTNIFDQRYLEYKENQFTDDIHKQACKEELEALYSCIRHFQTHSFLST